MAKMSRNDETRIRYRQTSIACGSLALVAGLAVLGGWLFGIERLKDFTFDGITMKANTALALALAGAALLLLLPENASKWRFGAGVCSAGFVSLIGALTLSQHIFGWNLHIDQLLVSELPGSAATVSPGRMGPPASTCYTLIGLALILLGRRTRRALVVSQTTAIAVAGVTFLNLVGNFYGAQELYSIALYTGISRQAALLLLATAIGLLTARPSGGLMALFSSDEPGGVILRRLLLPSLAFPVVFGRLSIYGIRAGWFDATFGIALFTLMLVVTLVAVTWWNSRVLNALSLRRLQAERERELLLESERHARAEVERSARLKDEFLATLSHELRTPLNAIMGWAHMLQRNAVDGATVRKGADVISRNAQIQSELVGDLLDMSRIISGKMRMNVVRVDMHAILNGAVDAVRLAADQRAVRLQVLLDPIGELVMGDAGRLQQVVWNLLSNAVKFTPKGGLVQLTLKQAESHVKITVADTGQGIAPEFLPHVFDRFRQADASITRNKGGLGLGLAIVKELVELHGGHVSIHSDGAGRGTTCIVELPINAASRQNPKLGGHIPSASTVSGADHLPGVRILVLEDDADTREILSHILSDSGANVTAVASAKEAMELLQRPETFDLLLSDIGLPQTSGYQLIRNLRAQSLRMPAIALTAYARSEDRERALEAGFQLHVTKPIEPSDLVAKIAALLESQPDPRTAASYERSARKTERTPAE